MRVFPLKPINFKQSEAIAVDSSHLKSEENNTKIKVQCNVHFLSGYENIKPMVDQINQVAYRCRFFK